MKKNKLTLEKLTVGSLTEAEGKKVMGGNSSGSNLLVNTVCISAGISVS
ncbi:hypothetical protein [Pedobacter sp. Leaf216]|nr:hypothetical protein [Pedobacter sp. Leaf216]